MKPRMETQVASPIYKIPADRRANLQLRGHYDAALLLLEPILRNTETPIGTRLYRAMSQLHAAHPNLNGHEIEALVAAVMRSLQRKHTADISN
jgi:hypothetical protein